jgi:hypothetical protein
LSHLFNVPVNWVENGVPPDYVVATQTMLVTRTGKVCKFPDTPVYNDSGSQHRRRGKLPFAR